MTAKMSEYGRTEVQKPDKETFEALACVINQASPEFTLKDVLRLNLSDMPGRAAYLRANREYCGRGRIRILYNRYLRPVFQPRLQRRLRNQLARELLRQQTALIDAVVRAGREIIDDEE